MTGSIIYSIHTTKRAITNQDQDGGSKWTGNVFALLYVKPGMEFTSSKKIIF